MPTKRSKKNNQQSKKKKQSQSSHDDNSNSSITAPPHENSIRNGDHVSSTPKSSDEYQSAQKASASKRTLESSHILLSSLGAFLLGVALSAFYFQVICPRQQLYSAKDSYTSESVSIRSVAEIKHTNTRGNEHVNHSLPETPNNFTRNTNQPSSFSQPCNLYVAKSTIPNAGLGMYTSKGILKGSPVGPSDIVIQLTDLNPHYYSFIQVLSFDYLWSGEATGGQYEGRAVLSTIPGVGMLANGHSDLYNTIPQSSLRNNGKQREKVGLTYDNGQLYRSTHPAAGSSSSYYNFTFYANRDILPGGEILVQYGKEWFDERVGKQMIPSPSKSSQEMDGSDDNKHKSNAHDKLQQHVRSQQWLEENGICLDNIEMKQSTNPNAGRGAFATRNIRKGDIVAPAPVIQITHRQSMELLKVKTDPIKGDLVEKSQQLLLNYCFGHRNSSILLYPIVSVNRNQKGVLEA